MGRNTNRRMSGLLLRGGVWHIDKVIHGTRVCESTGTSDLEEAEALLMRRLQAARATRLFGAREEHTFREAATKYLEENQHKRSLERDARALATLDPYIGELPLQRVHHDTLQPFVRARLVRYQSRDNQSRPRGRAENPECKCAAVARRIRSNVARNASADSDATPSEQSDSRIP